MKRRSLYVALVSCATGAAIAPLGCGSSAPAPVKPTLTADQLRDPTSCKPCHSAHYLDWAESMHAYASDDPVFLAMNARGQRETGGTLGKFCVKCHAPVAVLDNKTKDGLNLASLPPAEKGVTCFFCHSITGVQASHDNGNVDIANDLVLRGEIPDPQANTAHASEASPFQDNEHPESAQMCGTCHDITTTGGGHIERTFQEWSGTIFGASNTTCAFNGNCHMASSATPTFVAKNGPTNRTFHNHNFPAVDIAFAPNFPAPAQQQATNEESLANVLQGALCVTTRGGVRVLLDNASTGHFWPSGSAQDRRAWVEVVAEQKGAPFYSSGSVQPGTVVGSDPSDKDLWVLRDQMFGANDDKVAMFWQATCAAGNELPALPATETATSSVTHRIRYYPNAKNAGDSVLPAMPDKVTLAVHLQPIGVDVLNDLVASKDLDPAVAKQVPTLTVALPNPTDAGISSSLVWTAQAAGAPKFSDGESMMSCVTTLNFNVEAPTFVGQDPPTSCPDQ